MIHCQVCEIVLMRHGRSVDALMSANLSRLLDELARDLMTQARDGLIHRKRKLSAVIHAQDIDECFMLLRLQGNPYSTCRRQTLQLKARFLHGRFVVPFVFDAAPLHTLIELEEEDLFVCRPVGPPTPAVPGLHCVAWFLFCGGYLVLPSFPRVHVLL